MRRCCRQLPAKLPDDLEGNSSEVPGFEGRPADSSPSGESVERVQQPGLVGGEFQEEIDVAPRGHDHDEILWAGELTHEPPGLLPYPKREGRFDVQAVQHEHEQTRVGCTLIAGHVGLVQARRRVGGVRNLDAFEGGNLLAHAAIEDLEIVPRQSANQLAGAIANAHGHLDQFDPGPKRGRLRILGGKHPGTDRQRDGHRRNRASARIHDNCGMAASLQTGPDRVGSEVRCGSAGIIAAAAHGGAVL